tara:strand:- start:947 stop:1186 length:240 start_codon:yes stop_codon:yes gene_type:complete
MANVHITEIKKDIEYKVEVYDWYDHREMLLIKLKDSRYKLCRRTPAYFDSYDEAIDYIKFYNCGIFENKDNITFNYLNQ